MKQLTSQIDYFRRVIASDNASVAIKVTADSHMFDTHHVHHVIQVFDGIQDMIRTLLTEEAAIQAYLYHASLAGYGTKLVVGQVTGMVAERTTGRM